MYTEIYIKRLNPYDLMCNSFPLFAVLFALLPGLHAFKIKMLYVIQVPQNVMKKKMFRKKNCKAKL